MRRWLAPLLLPAIGAALWLLWAYATETWEVRAPLSGALLVAGALLFVVAGGTAKLWALVASPLVAATMYIVAYGGGDDDVHDAPGCDPSCGISPEGGALIVAAEALVLAAAGIAIVTVSRRIRGRFRRRTRIADRPRPVLWALGALARWTLGLALIALGATWGVFGFGPALVLVGVGVMVIALPRCVGRWRRD